ncbi:MAG: helix-turn-helix transcriptional regulator [Pseudomonadota bacterium]|nr:helix-turn-helix transcriptional regulator [Pseudomonadota bacterium]
MSAAANKAVDKSPKLTRSQRQVLELAAAGFTATEAGAELGIGRAAVEASLGRIRERLGARNSIEAVALAVAHGIISADAIRTHRHRRAMSRPRSKAA